MCELDLIFNFHKVLSRVPARSLAVLVRSQVIICPDTRVDGFLLRACVRGGTQAYFVLDELIASGELQESSKNAVLRCVAQQDVLQVRSCSLRF